MRRSPLIFIFITAFVDMLGYGMMIPLLPFFVQHQDGGAALAGSLSSLYALMQLISGPILGALSDRYGRKPVLLSCLFGTSVAFSMLGFANSMPLIFFAILVDGITGGNLTTVYAYIADVTTTEDRSKGMGIVGAAFGLGLIGGPALGSILSVVSLSAPAFCAAAIALLNVVYGLVVLPESLPPERRTQSSGLKMLNAFAQLKDIYGVSRIRLLLFALFTLNLAFSGLQTNFPLFSQSRFDWDARQNSVFYLFVGLTAVFVQGLAFRWLQPRLGEKRLSRIGLILMAVGLVGVAVTHKAWMLFPLIGIVAFGSGVSIPALSGLVSTQYSSRLQGRLMGGTQALLSLTNIIGPSLAGTTFEFINSSAPYFIGSVLALCAFALASFGFKYLEPVTSINELE